MIKVNEKCEDNGVKIQLFSYTNLTFISLLLSICMTASCERAEQEQAVQERLTEVTIVGEQFHINGTPTYEGQTWITSYGGEYPVEGLLMNARLVQGVFDDMNPETRGQWAYPDTREWDPDRNTQEFVDAMASWREHGLLGFTLNLQGGCPYGYCSEFPWNNSAFDPDGTLRNDFMDRTARIIDRADELGMVVILGYFYFGEDDTLQDEEAVIRAVENATGWLLEKEYTNVIVEINNECSHSGHQRYSHDILWCDRTDELINIAQNIENAGRSLYVSTSLSGGMTPPPNIVETSDFVFLHGNGVQDPERIVEMSREVREMDVYTPKPLVNNEDDQPWRVEEQGWGEEGNNFVASVKNYTSWGYFDFRRPHEAHEFNEGHQSVPVNWFISSERQRDFFDLLADITGSPGTPTVEIDFPREMGTGSVSIAGGRNNTQIEHLELIVNNQIVSTSEEIPFEFEINSELTSGEHWVKARAYYNNGEHEVIIESSYYRNPWWPYGGRF